ncbi:hypothetical protein C2857_005039 [Epichloe festucae Fl1]|uniref:ATP-dependent protease La domain-containing protein n=1 Tax=Epichloe festucae (strain Fl1) TaxID=877507 RepID=A0A7U3Q0V3_EPIFF|nr:hypothetical protein C2857_005039 [Epichloe festucae Fl1]
MSPEQPSLAETRLDADLEPVRDSESQDPRMPSASEEEQSHMEDAPSSTSAAQADEDHERGLEAAYVVQEQVDDDEDARVRSRPLGLEHVRDVVRLFQCRHCSKPLKNPTTLPCGRSLCKTCIPETHVRTSITYPAFPDRLQGFRCPFRECSKVHALSDCGLDVVLNKVGELMEEEIDRAKAVALELKLQTSIGLRNPWDAAGISSLQSNNSDPHVLQGGRLVSTWSLASNGDLAVETEVTYTDIPSPTPDDSNLVDSSLDFKSLTLLQTVTRNETDCQVCYALLHDPFTTGCGHTFCRPCLHRTLDHSHRCPICRRTLAMNPLLNPELCPSNERIIRLTELFWPEEKLAREEAVAAEIAARHEDLDLPLFVCTLAFPAMPTFLHIFEPRYRLMIRRALEGNRTFGMVLPKRPRDHTDRHFHQLGTLLRIINAQFYPDGRSLIETVGLTRFRVVRHGEVDGYTVAKTERIDDVSLEEEEAMEAAEAAARPATNHDSNPSGNSHGGSSHMMSTQTNANATNHSQMTQGQSEEEGSQIPLQQQQPTPVTAAELQTMSTRTLMRFASDFVSRMRSQSVPWLTARMLAIYGECPDDPAVFPWWFASMLPVKDPEKYRLLATSSVRERLKICGSWIVEWETTRW